VTSEVNILYINHYAGAPAVGMEYRPYYLAREWARLGHRVKVLAADFTHLRPQRRPVGDEVIDGVEFHWLRTSRYRGNGLGRAFNIARFLYAVWRRARDTARDFQPDAVIASSTYPMDIWVARHIARLVQRKRALLVFEVHDLWPLSLIELAGMRPSHPFVALCGRAERAAYRDADRVVSMLPKIEAYVASHGVDATRLAIVPNGIAPEDWLQHPEPLRDDVAHQIRRLRAAGRTVIGYAGSMGLPNALDTLLDAARILQHEAIGVVMVGDGHLRVELQRRIRTEGLTNVTWWPPIPKAQVASFLGAIDVAYIGWQRTPIYRFGIAPNKLMDYMMAGCAVLHSVQAGNDPVAESGCGLTVAPEAPTAVAEGLRRMAALAPEERAAMGRRGRAFVLAHHSYPVLARRFLTAMS
jgi:glycosyltransferase involved in cell wall biosynthesis